jgi:hypothetical protein
MRSLPFHRVVDPTMNLIFGAHHSCGVTYHSCERGITHLFVVMDYRIFTLKIQHLDKVKFN